MTVDSLAERAERLPLTRRAAAECVGTAMLLAAVVGSGIMGESLAAGNAAIALLANSIATGAALVALILALAPVSGAHFNPIVTLAALASRDLARRDALAYVAAQFAGALGGVALAHAMFGRVLLQASAHARSGAPLVLAEFVATFGLLLVITCVSRRRPAAAPFAVGAFVTGAYWFTSSTAFANPAVTLARAFTDTFSGIRAADVPAFVLAQVLGGAAAAACCAWLVRRP